MDEHVDMSSSNNDEQLLLSRKQQAISPTKVSGFLCVFVAVFLGVYINWPPPYLTRELNQWRSDGQIFTYKDKFSQLQYEIFYKDEIGNGTLGTVVCLHGFPTSSLDWKKIHVKLKEKFARVITPDFIGLGFSQKQSVHLLIMPDPMEIIEKKHNYSISQQADIIEALLEENNVSDFHILAHDYGDTVAQELIFRDNIKMMKDQESAKKILSLCLLNGGIVPEAHKPLLMQTLLLYPVLDGILSSLGNYWFFKQSFSSVFGPYSQPEAVDVWDWWVQLRYKDGNLILGKLLNYINERRIHRDRWVTALQQTSVPVLMIYGAKDPVNPPPFEELFRSHFPSATISVLENIGHYVQWEAPAEMMAIYSDFLNRF